MTARTASAAPRPRARIEMPPPPRAMAHAAQRGNRRRAWPRWTRPMLRSGLALLPVAGLFTAAFWMWQAGTLSAATARVHDAAVALSAEAGFALADVVVDGREETEPEAILRALGINRGDPILNIDLVAAKERLEALPWVAAASVERRLPDILFIRLTERHPMAIWQHDRRLTVIDRDGRPLADAVEMASRGNTRIETLPHVVGANAPDRVPGLLAALEKVPTLHRRVAAATRVSDRRWDLTLNNGVLVKLPEEDMEGALHHLAEMDAQNGVLDRDIVAVDMRVPDRVVLLTPTAAVPDDSAKKKKAGNRT
ncbi:cell division protein FtsQ/DivIB [Azospirillum halopraeferens]|uniref:cell division protein FtsQ/DivIB n=1 Tax=Azospirillum halopraeferens TaxID=34010 RepID=UPI00041407A3|nr:cell division protein FtsQ/DivIB [Azospirillum halopraeferens]